jgi:cold shock CspA family protein
VATGTMKFFNIQFGKGMLTRDGGKDVPVYHTELSVGADKMRPGQRVEFSIVIDDEGNAKAVNVRPV